jgi:hypothetical protein
VSGYRLVSTPALRWRFQVAPPDGLPEIGLTLFANDLIKSLSESSAPIYIREILALANWALVDATVVKQGWHLFSPDSGELSCSLAPYWAALYQLSARGHWLREHRPLRDLDGAGYNLPAPVPPVVALLAGDYQLTVLPKDLDLCAAVNMNPQRAVYPFNGWPGICEFAAMAEQLKAGQTWKGRHFLGYTYHQEGAGLQFAFRGRQNGITLNFSEVEWASIQSLCTAMFRKSELKSCLRGHGVGLWRDLRF